MRRQHRVIQLDTPEQLPIPEDGFHFREEKHQPHGGSVVEERWRKGDVLHIKYTRTTIQETEFGDITSDSIEEIKRPAFLHWADILDKTEIEPDDDTGMPWEEQDGYEHTMREVDRCEHGDLTEALGYVRGGRHGGQAHIIEIDDDSFAGDSPESRFDYFRFQGASKQVAAEMVACQDRHYIRQIADWYRNGPYWWYVKCEVDIDGREYEDAVGGVLDDEFGDYANKECRDEVAGNVAYALEAAGYVVLDKPELVDRTTSYNNARRLDRLRRLNMFNWSSK